MSVQSIRQRPVPHPFEGPVAALDPDVETGNDNDRRKVAAHEAASDLIEPQWLAAIAAGTD